MADENVDCELVHKAAIATAVVTAVSSERIKLTVKKHNKRG